MIDIELRDEVGNLDPRRVAAAIDSVGEVHADRLRAAQVLEHTKATVRARLILRFRGEGHSLRESELLTDASEEWETHIYAIAEARYQANLARARVETLTGLFEASRTAEATRRAEMVATTRGT